MSWKTGRNVWVGDTHFGIELGIEELFLVKSKKDKKECSSPGITFIVCFQCSFVNNIQFRSELSKIQDIHKSLRCLRFPNGDIN